VGKGPCHQLSIEWIFLRKIWLCWNVGPTLLSKVTLFSREVFWGAHVLRATTKKVVNFFWENKCTLIASVPPNVKSWLRAWQYADCLAAVFSVISKGYNLLTVYGSGYRKNNRPRIKTILHNVLKFWFDRTCFQRGEAWAICGKLDKEKK